MKTETEHQRSRPTVEDLAHQLAAYANPTRLRAMVLLAESPEGALSVGELQAGLGGTMSGVSQNLSRLRLGGQVVTKRDAQWILYRLAESPVTAAILALAGAASRDQVADLIFNAVQSMPGHTPEDVAAALTAGNALRRSAVPYDPPEPASGREARP